MALLDIENRGYIALVNPPAQTNAGADTVLTFVSEVNVVYVQNNTSANVNVNVDAPATPGSILVVSGDLFVYHKEIQSIHLYTAAAQNINGNVAGNIVVLGAE